MSDKYVVWSPSMGGWNKYHIARASGVHLSPSSAKLLPLCGTNQGQIISQFGLSLYKNVPFSVERPLEGKQHQCAKCQAKWWSLRQNEGYPATGIFAV